MPDHRNSASARADIVDVHAHFLPECYRNALQQGGHISLDGGMPIPRWSAHEALAVMDRHGIQRALLSVSSPGLAIFDRADEPKLARAINQEAAQLKADHPDRFGGMATLPLSHPAACVAEIDHVLDVLGLDGFILETNHRGVYPGDPSWTPVLAALNARRALVLFHPTSPACMDCIGSGRPAPLIEFPFDTTRAVVDLIYSGAAQRYPDIRFILPHAGGTIPFLAQRIAGFSAIPGQRAGDLTPHDVARSLAHFHYDTALSATPHQIGALKALAGIDRILFGSDWPFSPEEMLGGSIAALNGMDCLDAQARTAIFSRNAHRLLGQDAV